MSRSEDSILPQMSDKQRMKWMSRMLESYDKTLEDRNTELQLMRIKLEQRSWFLRLSLAINVALIAGLVVRFAT